MSEQELYCMVNAAATTAATQLFNHQAGQLKEEFIILKSILQNLFFITQPRRCRRTCEHLCIHKACCAIRAPVPLPRK